MQNFHCKCHHHQKQGANPTWALPGWVGGTKSGEDKGTFTSTTFQIVFVLLFVRLDQFAFVHFYVITSRGTHLIALHNLYIMHLQKKISPPSEMLCACYFQIITNVQVQNFELPDTLKFDLGVEVMPHN